MKKSKFHKPSEPKADWQDEFEASEKTNKWYEECSKVKHVDFKPVSDQVFIELKDEAKRSFDAAVADYTIKTSKQNSNFKWMKTVMFKGTASDRIAACTVSIQDKPLCSLSVVQNLVNMVKVGKKKECVMVIDTLSELFLSDLLRPNQKLKAFSQQPLSLLNDLAAGNAVTRRKLLTEWYFEDQLKELYVVFVQALNGVAHDVLDSNKEKAVSAMFKLLVGNPEQEKNLLTHLVNKLGDPSQKISSKAIYSLSQVLFKHPNMQGVVLSEVEKLLFRPNISQKAQYYGLCFLSQFYLSHETSEVARRLIVVYFSFFKACIKKGEVDTRMMSALLMGVNRAYPYAKLEMEKIADHIDTIYRVVHVANFNTSLHALSLLYQVSDSENSVSNRFYAALYKKMADSKFLTTTHQSMLLSLIYKSLLRDNETERVKVFVKRLLQLSLFMQPSFACGVLFLVSQVIGRKVNVQSLVLRQSRLSGDDDDEEEKYQDVRTKEEKEICQETNPLNITLGQASWNHCDNLPKKENPIRYNPLNRNPLYAGGGFCAYEELIHLKSHFHPTVALYATNILEGNIIKYNGDPLKDFTLIRFLERFVYKNPKKLDEGVVQGAHPTFGKRKLYKAKGVRALPVTSAGYLKEDCKNIPVDEVFMYSYLRQRYPNKRQPDDDEDSDMESVKSEEFEEMLDKMSTVRTESDDLDFMNEIGESLKEKKSKEKKQKKSDDDKSDEDEDEDDLSEFSDENDQDVSFSDDGESDLEMNDDDQELMEGLDEDDDEELVFDEPVASKRKSKKSKSDNASSLFASAEEFATLLDEEGSAKRAPGGDSALSNQDNASVKQIAWEENRNRWLQGFDRTVNRSKTARKGNIGNKRKTQSNFGNKFKKRKNK